MTRTFKVDVTRAQLETIARLGGILGTATQAAQIWAAVVVCNANYSISLKKEPSA